MQATELVQESEGANADKFLFHGCAGSLSWQNWICKTLWRHWGLLRAAFMGGSFKCGLYHDGFHLGKCCQGQGSQSATLMQCLQFVRGPHCSLGVSLTAVIHRPVSWGSGMRKQSPSQVELDLKPSSQASDRTWVTLLSNHLSKMSKRWHLMMTPFR